MNYKVLYRKYRPKTFDDVVGQNNTITLLKDSVINEKISHAYIFSGPRGTGKTSTAKIFAKAINCLNPHEADSNDIYEIDAASNNGVDQIREIIENIKLTPISLKYKVYIIDEVHMLSISAFNALLLTLEEPPKHAVFILATTDIEDVPITVLSRCQRLDFKKIKDSDIEKNLSEICKSEKIKIDDDAITEIASYSDGGMRDALSILDQLSKANDKITQDLVLDTIGVVSDKKISEMINSYKENDLDGVEKFLDLIRESSIDFKSLIKKIIRQLRVEALLVLQQKSDVETYEKYKKLCFDLASLVYKINVNVDVYTLLEFTLLPTVEKEIKNAEDKPKTEGKTDASKESKIEQKIDNFDDKKVPKSEQSIVNETTDNNPLIDVRINNCFVHANKQFLNEVKNFWTDFLKKVTDKKLKGILMDAEVVLASDEYIVLMNNFDNTVKEINNNLIVIEDYYSKFSNHDYKVIAVSSDIWNIKMDEYKKNIKNNVKYNIMKEPDVIIDNSILDDVFSNSKVEVQ